MRILIDTREQNALGFEHPKSFFGLYVTGVEKRKLEVGDYMAEFEDGHLPPFSFERKSIPDLYGTFGKGYKRFKREIMRAQELDIKLFIIVEGSLSEVLRGTEYSTIDGISIAYKCFTLWVRYGVQTIFCDNRYDMAHYITHFFIGIGKEYVRKRKEQKCC